MTAIQKKYRALLHRARQLLAAGWTKGTRARDRNSKCVNPLDPRARRYCVIGALDRATHGNVLGDYKAKAACRDALDREAISTCGLPAAAFNDNPKTTKAQLLAMVDRAIKRL